MGRDEDVVRRQFGRELRTLRTAAGFSQEQLAFRAGLHRTYVSLLERGERGPSLEALLRICRALNTSASELVSRLEARASRAKGAT